MDILQPLGMSVVEIFLAGEAVLGLGCTQPDYPAGIGFRRLGVTTSEYLKSPGQWLVHSELALLDFLDGGLGWAAVPRRLVAERLASGNLVELTFEACPFTQWNVGLDLLWNSAARGTAAGRGVELVASKTGRPVPVTDDRRRRGISPDHCRDMKAWSNWVSRLPPSQPRPSLKSWACDRPSRPCRADKSPRRLSDRVPFQGFAVVGALCHTRPTISPPSPPGASASAISMP
jgi:hypothetical protein